MRCPSPQGTWQRSQATENTALALAALADLQRTLALIATHLKLAALVKRRDAADRDAERMRKQFADFAARDRDRAASNPTACQRVAIDSRSLQPWRLLQEVESFLSEVDSSLKGATTKCSFCSAP